MAIFMKREAMGKTAQNDAKRRKATKRNENSVSPPSAQPGRGGRTSTMHATMAAHQTRASETHARTQTRDDEEHVQGDQDDGGREGGEAAPAWADQHDAVSVSV